MTIKTKTNPGPDVYLRVWTESKDGYFHMYATPCEQGDMTERGGYGSPSADTFYPRGMTGQTLDGLRVVSQGDERSARLQGDGTARLYGYGVEYRDVYSVDLDRAETMARTLRRIRTSLDKTNETDGYAESFAALVLRVGRALKVKGYVYDWPADIAKASGMRWRWVNATDAHAWMLSQERAFVARANATGETVTA